MSDNDNNMNYWANQWRNIGGLNVIPVDSKTKIPKVEYKHLKDKPIEDELHNYWIKKNMFKDGIDIINGSVWHNKYKKHLFLHTIDLDNQLAIKEVTNIKDAQYTLEDLSKRGVIVEQHPDDRTRAHILVYCEEPFPNLSAITNADDSLPRIEVKGIGKLTTVTPSMHTNGYNYEFIGDSLKSLESPVIHTEFMFHVNDILKKYGIEYLNGKGNKNTARIPIKNDEKVYQGVRHVFLINRANLIYGNNMNILPSDMLEQI